MRTTLAILLLLGCAGANAATTIPLLPGAGENRQGFVRLVHPYGKGGGVNYTACDDSGECHSTGILVPADRSVIHFNADDLENGNAEKGITGIGDGAGDWWLEVTGGFPFPVEALAYMRTKRDGFLTALHDTVTDGQAPIINPASNTNQRSVLRLVNTSDGAVAVIIRGFDDLGEERGPVAVTVDANAAVYLTSQQLEDMGLGDGDGKWRLRVTATAEVLVMGLMETPTGHLTNLSAVSDDTISVIASPPVASFTFEEDDEVPYTMHFDASGSTGAIVEYTWRYRRESVSTGTDPRYTHAYEPPNCYTVLQHGDWYNLDMSLDITDQYGTRADTNSLIPITNTVRHAGQLALVERISDAGGHAGTLTIWEGGASVISFRGSHGDLMYRCAQRERVPAERIVVPYLNVHYDSVEPSPDASLSGFFHSENNALRARTLVVNRSVFPSYYRRDADDIREHNIVFVAGTGNVNRINANKCDPADMPDRDVWKPNHSLWSCFEDSDGNEYRAAMQAIATGKALFAAAAVRRSDGTIVPNRNTLMCGDTKEYCFAVPAPSTSQATAMLSSSAFHLFQLYERAEDVVRALKSCAEDVGEPGVDREFGLGVLDLRCSEAMLPVIDQ